MELPQSQVEKYSDITNQLAKDHPSSTSYVDNAYQEFCISMITVAKK